MTTYLGYTVLDAVKHNAATTPAEGLDWNFVLDDDAVGKTFVEDPGGSPVPRRNFSWFMQTRADVVTFKAFIDSCKGMLTPFWVPTYNADLALANDINPGDGAVVIQKCNYTDFYFGQTARHHLAFIAPDGSKTLRKVTAAVDNGNGTETLTLDSTISISLPAASTMTSFLVFCRLASDVVEMLWHTNDMAEALLQLVELPREVPA